MSCSNVVKINFPFRGTAITPTMSAMSPSQADWNDAAAGLVPALQRQLQGEGIDDRNDELKLRTLDTRQWRWGRGAAADIEKWRCSNLDEGRAIREEKAQEGIFCHCNYSRLEPRYQTACQSMSITSAKYLSYIIHRISCIVYRLS